jgi:hypothetical protein
MAAIIRIKRSGVQGNPSILGQGELAYSYFNGAGGDRLYIGTGPELNGDAVNHTVIGGSHYVNLLGGEGDTPFGQLTPNTAIIVDSDGKVNEFKVDDLVFDGNVVSTVSGDIVFTPAGNVDLSGTRITNLAEPIDSSDGATKGYVDDLVSALDAATNLDLVGDSGTGSIVLASEPLTIAGGNGIVTGVDSDTNTLTITMQGGILEATGVTPGSYGSQTQIPTFTVDSDGRLSEAGTVDVATNLTLNGDQISLLDSDLLFTASDNLETTYDSETNTVNYGLAQSVTDLTNLEVGNLKLSGNEITSVDSSNTITIDPAPTDSDGGTLIIRGDLVVQGTQTIINSTVMSVNDLTLTLADEATNAAEADGAGIFIAGANASIVYNAANDVIDIDKGLNVLAPFTVGGVSLEQLIDSEVANLLTAGEGIDLAYNDVTNELLVSAEYASTTNAGIASFDSEQFTVSATGETSIYALDGGTY